MIKSGNLTSKGIHNVIVVAGPQGTSTPTKENQLYSCYYNNLELSHSQGKTSIAFLQSAQAFLDSPKTEPPPFHRHPNANLTISIHALNGLNDYENAI